MDDLVLIKKTELETLIENSVKRALEGYNPQKTELAPEPEQKFLAPEAASYLGIDLTTLYTKNSKGEIPSCKPAGSKRLIFYKSDLDSYLKSGRRKTHAEIEQEAESYCNSKR